MKGKHLVVLAILAVVLVILARTTSTSKKVSAPDLIGDPVLADIDINAVATMTIHNPQSTATVSRAGGTWTVTEKNDYPGSFETIRNTLMALSELKVAEVVNADDALKNTLGITAHSVEAESKKLDLAAADGTVLASLLIGASHMRKVEGSPAGYGGFPDGRYVSTDGGETVFLVSDNLNQVSEQPLNWIDKELINVSGSDLQHIHIKGPGRQDLELARADGTLVLTGLGENEELDTSKLSSFENALSYLNLEDVADPALTDDLTGMTNAVLFVAKTTKGETYALSVGGNAQGGARYMQVRVAFEEIPKSPEEEATEDPAEEETEETKAKKKAEELARQQEISEQRDKALKLDQKLSPWTFIIPDYKAESILTTREDLVKEKEPPEEEPEPVKKEEQQETEEKLDEKGEAPEVTESPVPETGSSDADEQVP